MKHKDARTISTEAEEALRMRSSVEAVRGGMSKVEAVWTYGVHRGTVKRWMKEWRGGGKHSLRKKKQERPKGKRINKKQTDIVRSYFHALRIQYAMS